MSIMTAEMKREILALKDNDQLNRYLKTLDNGLTGADKEVYDHIMALKEKAGCLPKQMPPVDYF
jgi:hypothetical protein|nr:MAG TPA: hypothetical protein [Caudoviricetes sp.]